MSRGPKDLGSVTYAPQYTEEEINGPGCGICKHGTAAASLPAGDASIQKIN